MALRSTTGNRSAIPRQRDSSAGERFETAEIRATLLEQSREIYRAVAADPAIAGPRAADLVKQARYARVPEALVPALRALAWFERSQLKGGTAKELLDEAARLARRHGLESALGDVLITRAAVNQELGHVARAQRDLDAAARLLPSDSDDVRFQRAVLHHNMGRLVRSAELYASVLRSRTAGVEVRAKAANNWSIIVMQRGDPAGAMRLIDVAAELAGRSSPQISAIIASTRAWALTQSGRLPEGMEQFAVAARMHVDAGLPLAEHYLEYVDALADLRLLPEAREVAATALDDLVRSGARLMAAEAAVRVALLGMLSGDLGAATRAADSARRWFRDQHRSAWQARADVVRCAIQLQSGNLSTHWLTVIRRAADTLDRLGFVADAVEAHLVAGRIALAVGRPAAGTSSFDRATALGRNSAVLVRLRGHLAGALRPDRPDAARLQHCRTGLRDLAGYRAAFSSMELRVRASGHGAQLGRLGLEMLLRQGRPAAVLSWVERTRAAALIAVEPVGALGHVEGDLAELRQAQSDLADAGRSGGEVAILLDRQRRIEDRIRRATWNRRSGGSASDGEIDLATLRAGLRGRVLVEYGVTGDQVFAIVVGRQRSHIVPLAAVSEIRKHVDRLLFSLRRLALPGHSPAARQAARAAADFSLQALERLLFQPLRIDAEVPLVVSPPGSLTRVPWSALRRAPVAVVPAASFWARTSQAPRPLDKVLLVAGPDLPGATAEVDALRELHPAPTVLQPPDSTIEAVLPHLKDAHLAHMACHGWLRADNPAFSALQLHNGSLTLHELELRGAAPHRMVLAACESAVETPFDGEEVLGFVSALMARGTSALIASIVVVPDAAAVPLMLVLHDRLRAGTSFHEALHVARSEMDRRDPRDFVNWCAFNAYGAA